MGGSHCDGHRLQWARAAESRGTDAHDTAFSFRAFPHYGSQAECGHQLAWPIVLCSTRASFLISRQRLNSSNLRWSLLRSIWDPNSMSSPIYCWNEEAPQNYHIRTRPNRLVASRWDHHSADSKVAWQKFIVDTPRSLYSSYWENCSDWLLNLGLWLYQKGAFLRLSFHP